MLQNLFVFQTHVGLNSDEHYLYQIIDIRYQITRGKNKEIGFFKELTLNQRFAWFLLRSELTIILELTSCRTGIFEDASAKRHVHVIKIIQIIQKIYNISIMIWIKWMHKHWT